MADVKADFDLVDFLRQERGTQLDVIGEQIHQHAWDVQIAEDFAAGRLDFLIEEANREFEAGNCKPL